MATRETIFLLERRKWSDDSLSFPKDPQKHGGTFFSRILDFQAIEDSGFSGDLLFGWGRCDAQASLNVDRRCSPGFFFSECPRFIELPHVAQNEYSFHP